MKSRLKRLLRILRVKLFLTSARILGKTSVIVKLASGQLFRLRIHDTLGHQILNDESFETVIRNRIMTEVKPDTVVLDIGANIGYYSVQFAKRVGPLGRVLAFEPNPEMLSELRTNIELNQLKNVSIQPFALSDKEGKAEFFCPPAGYEGHGSLQPNASFKVSHTIKVLTRTLDDTLKELGIASVDFVKIDVEGAERHVFRGAHQLLSGPNRPTIFFECAETACQPFGHYVFDVLQDLAQYDYVIEQIDYGNWLAKPKIANLHATSSSISS